MGEPQAWLADFSSRLQLQTSGYFSRFRNSALVVSMASVFIYVVDAELASYLVC